MKVPIENADKVFRTYVDVMRYDEFIASKDSRAFVIIGHVEDGYRKPDISIWLDKCIDIHSHLSLFRIWASSDDWRFLERGLVFAANMAKYIMNNNIDKFSYTNISGVVREQLCRYMPNVVISFNFNSNIDDKSIPITNIKCDKDAFEKVICGDDRWAPAIKLETSLNKKSFYILPFGGIVLSDKFAGINFDEFMKLITISSRVLVCTSTRMCNNITSYNTYLDDIVKLISEK